MSHSFPLFLLHPVWLVIFLVMGCFLVFGLTIRTPTTDLQHASPSLPSLPPLRTPPLHLVLLSGHCTAGPVPSEVLFSPHAGG